MLISCYYLKFICFFPACWRILKNPLNPLSANVGYIRHDTVVTSDSCNSGHSENYEKLLTFSCKSFKFYKTLYFGWFWIFLRIYSMMNFDQKVKNIHDEKKLHYSYKKACHLCIRFSNIFCPLFSLLPKLVIQGVPWKSLNNICFSNLENCYHWLAKNFMFWYNLSSSLVLVISLNGWLNQSIFNTILILPFVLYPKGNKCYYKRHVNA